jgi:hypothetical protein
VDGPHADPVPVMEERSAGRAEPHDEVANDTTMGRGITTRRSIAWKVLSPEPGYEELRARMV